MMSQQSTYTLLPHIHFPADLRKLRLEDLPILCKELRENILDELAQNPGHLASSLGAIELTVALHYVFNTPEDRIVWDVGHQAYGHKILTGRREQFHTNRQLGGISPFPSPKESEYDTFVCGHASNAISAALGMSVAAFKKGQHERNVVAIIGDGAMSGGLAFEGLNNTSETPNNLLIILNDNNMSISDSVGGMKRYLHQVHTSSFYNRWRNKLAKKLEHWGWLNSPRKKSLIRFNNAVKSLISAQQNIFEGMNIRYFGPTDGHNVLELVRILRRLKNMQGPKLLHLKTIKGKGYDLAEENPIVWHAPGKFNRAEGERIENNENNQPPKFQDVFGETLVELAKQNPLIVGVTPAMLTGCSMCILAEQMPDRCFDVGIAEGHATTFSSGMAKDGLIPFCNIYSSFAQRAYDNIIHDTAILALPVIFCLDRAGLVGEDGPTHHGTFDIAALRPIPNLTIASPLDEHELRRLMYTAQLPNKGPFVIRYPRGGGRLIDWKCPLEEIEVGKGRVLKQGDGTIALISFGPIGMIGADAITEIEKTHPSANISHIDLRFVKPLDKTLILSVAQTHRHIVTLEDGVRNGGVGSAILELLSDHGIMVSVERIGLPDKFIEHGAVSELHRLCQTDKIAIIATLTRLLTNS